jgi:hypothetical protein
MRVNRATFIAWIFLLLARISSGAFPSSRKFAIYFGYLGATSTLNKFSSSKLSSIPVGYSLVSSRDR